MNKFEVIRMITSYINRTGITQVEFGKRTSIDAQKINKILRGTANPNAKDMQNILNVTGHQGTKL